MEKKLFILLIILFFSCTLPKSRYKNIEFDTLLRDYYEGSLELYRINATFSGDSRYTDTLPNFLSVEFKKKGKEVFGILPIGFNQF